MQESQRHTILEEEPEILESVEDLTLADIEEMFLRCGKKWTTAGEEVQIEDMFRICENAVDHLRSVQAVLPRNTWEAETLQTVVNMLWLSLPDEWHQARRARH